MTIAGNLQDELGCSGDWQPDCAANHLTYDASDTVWQRTFTVPAGSFEYKATLNDSWDENYGANAERNGPNIPLSLGANTDVKFYYSHATHWVIDNVNGVIATVPGSYQDEIGCPGDWQPDCLRSWLQDPDGDGNFTTETGLSDAVFFTRPFATALPEECADFAPDSGGNWGGNTGLEDIVLATPYLKNSGTCPCVP